jgi:hypothetical protein
MKMQVAWDLLWNTWGYLTFDAVANVVSQEQKYGHTRPYPSAVRRYVGSLVHNSRRFKFVRSLAGVLAIQARTFFGIAVGKKSGQWNSVL